MRCRDCRQRFYCCGDGAGLNLEFIADAGNSPKRALSDPWCLKCVLMVPTGQRLWTASKSSVGWTGLARIGNLCPAELAALKRSLVLSCPEKSNVLQSGKYDLNRMARVNSVHAGPFMPGIITSVMSKSGHCVSAACIAASALSKPVALKPEKLRIVARVDAMIGSSSTTKTCCLPPWSRIGRPISSVGAQLIQGAVVVDVMPVRSHLLP